MIMHFVRNGFRRQMQSPLGYFTLIALALALISLSSCTGEKPPTSMDQLSTLQRFTLTVEKKYKREAYKNDIDLHFLPVDQKRVKVVVTYKDNTLHSTADSVADAAIEHYRRLAKESPEMSDVEYILEKEVKLRPKTPGESTP